MAYAANESYVLADFSFGWNLSTSPLDLDKRSLTDVKNFNLTTQRGLEKRAGMTALYPTASGGGAQVQDLFEYKAPNGTTYVLVAVGTKIQAYYSASWHDLHSVTTGLRYSFAVHQGFCYGANGTDANFKFYNTTVYGVGIAPPAAAPTVTEGVDDPFVFIADAGNHRIVKRLASDLSYVSQVGSEGSGNDQFSWPSDPCSDGTYIYIPDQGNDRIVKRLASDLSYVSQIGSHGTGNDQFDVPMDCCTDGTHIYITDQMNNRIVKRLASDLSYVSQVGTAGSGNDNFNYPIGVCFGGTHIYVVDTNNHRIVKRLASDLSYVSQVGSVGTGNDQFTYPYDACYDGTHIYVIDTDNHRIVKRLASDLSYVSQIGSVGTGNDNFDTPLGDFWVGGHVYVADTNNDRIVKRLASDLSYVSQVGTAGSGNDQFNAPVGGCSEYLFDVGEGGGGLTGRYQYVYCYRRSTPNGFTGNPSPASVALDLTAKKFNVAYTLSADTQVDKIVIYRTLNLNTAGTDPLAFYKVVEVTNATSSYNDETADSALGTSLEIDNTVPPKAKFVILHKDRIFYINCPAETDGGSLVRWSKVGIGDAAPSVNYQYFDRKDGEDITGAASVGDYLIIFKRNRIFVLEGDFANFYAVSHGVGCIASWGIIPFEDKVIFLSEEGWKSFDGVNLYDLSKSIRPLAELGYITPSQNARYSAAYYPVKDQFLYLCNHSTLTKRVFVGHFIVPLLYINKGIPEQLSQNIVGWTYHEYPNHTLTCLGAYTDSLGIQRVIAGSSNGYVYLLDSGNADVTYDIPYAMLTGWQPLGKSPGVSKTVRLGFLSLSASGGCTLTFTIEKDYESPFYSAALTIDELSTAFCGYCYCGYTFLGSREGITKRVAIPGSPGQLYRFGLSGTDKVDLTLQAMTFMYRTDGFR